MASNRITITSLAILALSLPLVGCGETANETATAETAPGVDMAIIEVRQDNLEDIGDAFKAIRGQLEGSNPDFAVLQSNAQIIDANARKISGHFPAGTGISSGADTEALETIWEKPADFASASDRLVAASAAMLAATNSGDIGAVQAAAKELGGACKNCHDQFREKDD